MDPHSGRLIWARRRVPRVLSICHWGLTGRRPLCIRRCLPRGSLRGAFSFGFHDLRDLTSRSGGVPEWLKGTDCKSVGFAYAGSNPAPSTRRDNRARARHYAIALRPGENRHPRACPYSLRVDLPFRLSASGREVSDDEEARSTCATLI